MLLLLICHADIALNAAFTIEMILRILSLGGVLQYLSHPWNAFDGVMVLAGYTTFIPMSGASGGGLEGIKALRALRAMRPLRTITRCVAVWGYVWCLFACTAKPVAAFCSPGVVYAAFCHVNSIRRC